MIKRALLTLIVLYTIIAGATYNGILAPELRLIDVIMVVVVLLGWMVWRRRWTWYRTPLDWAIVLWICAFAFSLITNLDSWRRIVIGLWFIALYIGTWYLLYDVFANGALKRLWLIDALLMSGVPVVFVGYAQVENALVNQMPLPRPVGTLGNANALAAFLVMLLPFIAGRLYKVKTVPMRVLLAVYGLAALGLLVLSFSRGGWIAGAVALAVWVGLSLPLAKWWAQISLSGRIVIGLLVMCIAAVSTYFVLASFGIVGRSVELRTWIYQTALRLFAEHPLTGTGLFTFGAGLARLNSLPPQEPHSHAHNLILNVAAEMGIVGLLALALTTFVVVQLAHRNRRDPLAAMAVASFAGFAVHQMFDMPIMMPMLALLALVILSLIVPTESRPIRARWPWVLSAVGGFMLAVSGVWNAVNYSNYVGALRTGLGSGEYGVAAARLQPLIDGDPASAIYEQQRGMLLGLQATAGEPQAAQDGAVSFERFTNLEPSYASGFANLAALDEQIGKLNEAAAAMREAILLAPQWSLVYRAGVYIEAAGDATEALDVYRQVLRIYPDVSLLPDWNASPVRRAIPINTNSLSPLAQTVLALENGGVAQQIWTAFPEHTLDVSRYHIVALMLALARGDQNSARSELQAAQHSALTYVDRSWSYLGMALLDPSQVEMALANAREALTLGPADPDWELGQNIAYIQFLQVAIPRQFLPQVGYSEIDAVLTHLLYSPDALSKLRAASRE